VVANPFPPLAGAGTYRVLRFLRHLPTYGWEPTVLTTVSQGPGAPPEFVRIVRTPVPVPSRLLGRGRRVTRLNRWLFVPDQYAPWIPTAIAAGRRLLGDEHFDALLSSHPRASGHIVAAGLARLTGTPWLADYRDRRFANTVVPYVSPAHEAAHRRLEAWALRQAGAASAVNRLILDDIVAHHPQLAGRGHVLPNGYDDADPVETVDLGPGFWFVHTGKLYKRDQSIEAFLDALVTLPDDVKALFVGDAPRVEAIVQRLGVGHRVRVEGTVPHARALGYQHAADALLLVNTRRLESTTSKVFEYLRSGRPQFAITMRDGAADRLLSATGGSVTVDHDDDLREPLARFVDAVRAGRGPVTDAQALSRYDMVNVTGELAAILDRLARGGGW
jgi:hypothetical protein